MHFYDCIGGLWVNRLSRRACAHVRPFRSVEKNVTGRHATKHLYLLSLRVAELVLLRQASCCGRQLLGSFHVLLNEQLPSDQGNLLQDYIRGSADLDDRQWATSLETAVQS